ncbi:MAG: SAM-dependent methyltransferase [Bacteroidetes bacterium CG2_30_33_31]|nr:MAG: SAM-dependent methyltransferase [Bacteroidetes bacterium CG2_30_33_31]
MNKGKIYLIPNMISDSDIDTAIPRDVISVVQGIHHFIVEDVRTARRYLRKIGYLQNFDTEVEFFILNKHTDLMEIIGFLAPALASKDMGLISESGVPCVADPGNLIVELAHQYDIQVVPLVGPSSIILSLMASGFNGQNFAFVGYLPIDDKEKSRKLKDLENKILHEDQTQIFIETPYRNQKLFQFITKVCSEKTMLCVACNINASDEFIKSKSIENWKKSKLDINKKNTIFLLYK